MPTENANAKTRIAALDYIRVFAILCVILTHVTENVYTLNTEFLCNAGRRVRWIGIMLFTSGRFGVPLFLFLTGYLMLDKIYDTEKTLRLWKQNLLGMLITTELWIVIYYFYAVCILKTAFSFSDLLKELLLFKQANCTHLWYMPAILGLYIFIPFIANILNTCDKKLLLFPLTLSILYLFVPSSINVILTIKGETTLRRLLDLSFSGGNYGILLIVGWMVKQNYFNSLKKQHFIILAAAGYSLTVLLELYAYSHNMQYNVWYDSITLLIASFSIFNLILNAKIARYSKIVTWFSKMSFAVYLCHPLILNILFRFPITGSYEWKELILYLATVIFSFAAVFVISFHKKISKFLFYMK